MQIRTRLSLLTVVAGTAALLAGASVMPAPAVAANDYTIDYLVSNQPGAKHKDPHLQNPWGVAFLPGAPFWISDNNSGLSTLYDGDGNIESLVVTIPLPPPPRRQDIGKFSAPTGMVSNSANDFFVEGDPNWPALFIFDSEDGTIAGWFSAAGTSADLVVDNSLNGAGCKPVTAHCQGAVYKGLALGSNKTNGPLLFATNFRSGKIEVYNNKFTEISLGATAFLDDKIPAGYSPYGIANLGGDLYVTYAKQDGPKHDSVACAGCGFVDIFTTDGKLVSRLLPAGKNAQLDAPWGVALAPDSFWPGGAVLVGNFGNGWINAFDHTGKFLGSLQNAATKQPVVISNLWTIMFTGPHGPPKTSPSTLYFTSGPTNQTDGRFGAITLDKPVGWSLTGK
jgi:uncharacterized protein (TIGR03118 family)